jgi:hypothetical protein
VSGGQRLMKHVPAQRPCRAEDDQTRHCVLQPAGAGTAAGPGSLARRTRNHAA